MSCESPVKITVYEAEGFIEYVLMGIGSKGKDILAQLPSLSELRDKNGLKSILICDDSAFRYNDYCYLYPRNMITNELQQADMLFCLVNLDCQDDYESVCNIVQLSKKTNKSLVSVCVYNGNSSREHIDRLKGLFTTIIELGGEDSPLTPWLFVTNMEHWGFVSVDFADIISVIKEMAIAHYYQFEIPSIEHLSGELSQLKKVLLRNECSNSDKNIALGLFEIAPSVGLEDLNTALTALYTDEYIPDGGLFNYIVWSMHWNDALSDKSMRVSLLYGEGLNRGNQNEQN